MYVEPLQKDLPIFVPGYFVPLNTVISPSVVFGCYDSKFSNCFGTTLISINV